MPTCWSSTDIYNQLKIGKFIEEETAIGSALKLLVIDPLRDLYKRLIKDGSFVDVPGTDETVKVSRAEDHALSMDLSREETRIVWNDFEKMLADWSNTAKSNDQLFGIMIVPSKQRVLVEYATTHAGTNGPAVLDDAIKNEKVLEARIAEDAGALGIPVENALGPMLKAKEEAMRDGEPLYPSGDGHPEEAGYAAYAEAAQALVLKACETLKDNPICVQALAQPAAAQP